MPLLLRGGSTFPIVFRWNAEVDPNYLQAGGNARASFACGIPSSRQVKCAQVNQQSAAAAIAQAKWISNQMGHGRLDVYQAVQAWVETSGPTVRPRKKQLPKANDVVEREAVVPTLSS
jgi:hypothetical protein